MKTALSRLSLIALALCASPAAVAAATDNLYLGAMASYVTPDSARDSDNGIGGKGFLGLPLTDDLNLELVSFGHLADADVGSVKHTEWSLGADLMLPLLDEGPVRPFVLVGAGYTKETSPGLDGDSGYANAGVGALVPLNDLLSLRGEVRYVNVFSDPTATGSKNLGDVHVSLGVQFALGKAIAPAPKPAKKVAATPASRPLASGAPTVPPRGPLDSDGDRVPDEADRCAKTPKGVKVDDNGCALDADDDGVADYLDKCPDTTAGLKVDATGCVSGGQTLVLKSVEFEYKQDRLTAAARQSLAPVVAGLKSQPGLQIEIAGHTDGVGGEESNLALSGRRAEAVRTVLIEMGVNDSQIVARGYGKSEPIASNDTEAGRAKNRRVEFRVLGR